MMHRYFLGRDKYGKQDQASEALHRKNRAELGHRKVGKHAVPFLVSNG